MPAAFRRAGGLGGRGQGSLKLRMFFWPLDVPQTVPDGGGRFEALARHMHVLGSETRLDLLHALRTPQVLHEIRIEAPVEGRPQERRVLSRQGVTRHLEQLQQAGLVHRIPGGSPSGRGDAYVLNHERLFAMVDEMRNLARLRPLVVPGSDARETAAAGPAEQARLPDGPRLLLVYGREDGIAFSLGGPESAWRIGRAPGCEIRLDYDPFLSGEHCVVRRSDQGLVVHDLNSRNGTWVNWTRIPPGGTRALRPGDAIIAGRSVLVLQR